MSVATQSAHGIAHAQAKFFQPSLHATLAASRTEAQEEELSYAGDITPQEAWELFSSGAAKLIDVRTDRELQRVGHVPETLHVEWLTGTSMSKNPRFIDQLESVADKDDVVLFLCRSGKRSVAAAEAAAYAGFKNAFNVLEGFEGDGNPRQGWLNQGLPSVQDPASALNPDVSSN